MHFKLIIVSIVFSLAISIPAFAKPSFRVAAWKTSIVESVTPEAIVAIKKAIAENKINLAKTPISLEKIKNEDLQTIVKELPEIVNLEIGKNNNITDISPLATLKNLKSLKFELDKLQDVTPLAVLEGLEKIDVKYDAKGQNLKWMSKLNNLKAVAIKAKSATSLEGLPKLEGLKEIRLSYFDLSDLKPLSATYPNLTKLNINASTVKDISDVANLKNLVRFDVQSARVKDFSPLAKCPKLEVINYYGVHGADFSSFESLKQVKIFEGGYSDMASIDWIKDMPKLESITFLNESITDFTPLKNAPKLKQLFISSMKNDLGDLAFVSELKNVQEFRIARCKAVTNFAAIANMSALEKLTFEYNNIKDTTPISLDFIYKLENLKKLYIFEGYYDNLKIAGLKKLEDLIITKANIKDANPALDLSVIKDLENLAKFRVNDSNVTNVGQIGALPNLVELDLGTAKGYKAVPEASKLPKLKKITVSRKIFTKEQLPIFPKNVFVSLR